MSSTARDDSVSLTTNLYDKLGDYNKKSIINVIETTDTMNDYLLLATAGGKNLYAQLSNTIPNQYFNYYSFIAPTYSYLLTNQTKLSEDPTSIQSQLTYKNN